MALDFDGLNSILVSRFYDFVPDWLPAGKLNGKEFEVGNLHGAPGDSLKVNIQTGIWADFATGDKGGDLISLYAKIYNVSQGKAYKDLAEKAQFTSGRPKKKMSPNVTHLKIPPHGTRIPEMFHPKFGQPKSAWCYKTINGDRIFFQARYDAEDKKVFCPWSWDGEKWVMKAPSSPRTLFQLEKLNGWTGPVMIVEGEKAAVAAQKIVGKNYAVVSWLNGTGSVKKNDWSILKNKHVLLWPDADTKTTPSGDLIPYDEQPGPKAMKSLALILSEICASVKILDVSDHENGWDAADALEEQWDWDKLLTWARPRASVFEKPILAPTLALEKPSEEILEVKILEKDPEPPAYLSEAPLPEDDELVGEYPDHSLAAIHEQAGIAVNSKGKPIINLDNTVRALRFLPSFRNKIFTDTYTGKLMVEIDDAGSRPIRDEDILKVQLHLQQNFGLTMLTKMTVADAIELYASANKKNCLQDWVRNIKWDGTPRINLFFEDIFGAKPDDYVRQAGKNMWISIAARIFEPGCKVDNMVILQGGQGLGKSRVLYEMGGEYFTENNAQLGGKDFFQELHGHLIIEFAELDYFRKADVNTLKRIITQQVDNYRPPYGRYLVSSPRSCIFIGTTNQDEFLVDDTGARRFWPITCTKADFMKVRELREQYFAEAYKRFKDGESWWEIPHELAEQHREIRQVEVDERGSVVVDWVKNNYIQNFRLIDLMTGPFGIEISRIDRRSQMELASMLRQMGFKKVSKSDGKYWATPQQYLE